MVKIINRFSGPNPISEALSSLGKTMFGDNTANALKNENLYALQRSNAETDNLAKRVAASGAQNLGSDSITQAMLIASGLDPAVFGKIGLMGAATGEGAKSEAAQNWQVGTGQPYSNTYGAFDATLGETARNNDMQSADRRYGYDAASADRRYQTDQTVGESRRQYDQKPTEVLGPSGKPIFVPQIDATGNGYSPILSETDRKGTLLGDNFGNLDALTPAQRQVLGANPSSSGSTTPRNYIVTDPITGKPATFMTYDGVNDAQSGKPLPPGGYIGNVQGGASETGVTNSVASGLQERTIANKKFNYLLDTAMSLTEDPTLFGAQGAARSLAQEVAAGASGLAAAFGPNGPGADVLLEARKDLASRGLQDLLPELYDPNLPKVDTVWALLAYQGAAALAGQEGRSISDKDIDKMKVILGDPKSLFSSAQMMRSKLQVASDVINHYDAIDREALGGGAPVTPAPPQQHIPDGAITLLQQHPELAPKFDEMYGAGASQQYLGAQ